MSGALQSVGDLAISQSMARGAAAPSSSDANIDKAAKGFAGMFFAQMLEPMFEGVGVNPVFGGGHGEEIMRGFLVQEYGKIAAQDGRFGIADAVKREMLRAQASKQAAAQNATKKGGVYDSIE